MIQHFAISFKENYFAGTISVDFFPRLSYSGDTTVEVTAC
jgi:hypothetical protein